MRKLFIAALFTLVSLAYAEAKRNQGALNNLCQNLTAACRGGDQSTCLAAKDTGCSCDESQGTCTRGNYSN